ncbi:hypothetical protein [Mesorhizobium retamae]|uniref:Uncharacterized protein n=1 Tax=Mesorhizobium retamae TaxID=2912854 RepID=A0ABS9QM48_9HYPH|nr:hypothetical protein [Mesorhizobium sp. IRAMC:0171]MCG7508522.1 hypothetical protein [Mesorhizobium sp. IRAMC:0171]
MSQTTTEALSRLESALDRWRKASATVAGGWRTQADIRDRDRLLMELDEAITRAEPFQDNSEIAAALDRANQAMMGRPVA